MSLEKKDLRMRLHPDVHAGLGVLADICGKELSELAEEIIGVAVKERIHAATLIAERAARLGIAGKPVGIGRTPRDLPGT